MIIWGYHNIKERRHVTTESYRKQQTEMYKLKKIFAISLCTSTKYKLQKERM